MAKGGARNGAGRKTGSTNALTKAGMSAFLDADRQYALVEKAYKMALEGKESVMNKLLDKCLPSLNKNENEDVTFANWLREMQSRDSIT